MPAGSDTDLQNLIDRGLTGDAALHMTPAQPRLRPAAAAHPEDVPRLPEPAALGADRRRVPELHAPAAPGDGRGPGRVGAALLQLAAVQVRRELLDLAKHHFGPEGGGANHHTDGQPADDEGGAMHESAEEPDDLRAGASSTPRSRSCPQTNGSRQHPLLRGADAGGGGEGAGRFVPHPETPLASARLKLYEALKRDGQG